MKKSILYLLAICCFILSRSCKNTTGKETTNKDELNSSESIHKQSVSDDKLLHNSSMTENDPVHLAKEFLTRLEKRQSLDLLMSDNWTFIYHEDNRCDGSTDGSKNNLSGSEIDKMIRIKVENDGEGWVCTKRKPRSFELEFTLKEQIKSWDRFQIAEESKPEENIFYILGSGASDYIIIYFEKSGDKFLIVKLEYKSEDPG